MEVPSQIQCLLQYRHRVTAGDHNAGRQTERVAQALDRRDLAALQNDGVAHRLHAEHTDVLLLQDGKHDFLEALIVSIHYVEGHLHRIELEIVLVGDLEHVLVNVWALVPSKADIAELSSCAGLHHNFHRTACRKNALGIVHADDLVKLQQVEV